MLPYTLTFKVIFKVKLQKSAKTGVFLFNIIKVCLVNLGLRVICCLKCNARKPCNYSTHKLSHLNIYIYKKKKKLRLSQTVLFSVNTNMLCFYGLNKFCKFR